MSLLLNLIISTIAVVLAGYLVPGVFIQDLATGVILAIVLGVLNTFVKPVVKILTLPINILTLGLFSLVVNVAFIYLAEFIVPGFELASVWSALFYSIALSLLTSFLAPLTD